MSHQSETGTLDPAQGGPVNLTIICGYGQSIHTKVDYIENGQIAQPITAFPHNADQKKIAQYTNVRNKEFRVFCTIHDVIDPTPGQEVEDIELTIRVSCNDSKVEKTWTQSTQGTGAIFTFSLDVFTL